MRAHVYEGHRKASSVIPQGCPPHRLRQDLTLGPSDHRLGEVYWPASLGNLPISTSPEQGLEA